jgi:nicotinamidase-related amidase
MGEYKYSFVAVDIQNDFASPGGKYYTPKPSIKFLKNKLFTFLEKNKIEINEIISDYRQPRPGDRGDCCHPGEWGFKSVVPRKLRKSLWIKCMNSPVWVRENIGIPKSKPGLPYPDPKLFRKWLKNNVGDPDRIKPILLGLTIDCCVLSTSQELSWQGYYPIILREAVDHASGTRKDRDMILKDPIPNWAEVIDWKDLKIKL